MNDQRIRSLLRRADGAAPPPAPQADLPGTIRRTIRQRRIITTMAASCAIMLAGLLAMWRLPRPAPPIAHNPAPPASHPTAPAVDLAALEADARLHSEMAERLWAAEIQRARARIEPSSLAAVDPCYRIEQQQQRAALIIVDQGDYLMKNEDKAAAAENYRQAIQLYPRTHWASVARERLEQMGD